MTVSQHNEVPKCSEADLAYLEGVITKCAEVGADPEIILEKIALDVPILSPALGWLANQFYSRAPNRGYIGAARKSIQDTGAEISRGFKRLSDPTGFIPQANNVVPRRNYPAAKPTAPASGTPGPAGIYGGTRTPNQATVGYPVRWDPTPSVASSLARTSTMPKVMPRSPQRSK